MGLCITLFLVFAVLCILCLYFDSLYFDSLSYSSSLGFFSFLFGFCSIIMFARCAFMCVDLYTKEQGINTEIVNGEMLSRLLQENYNPDNLNKALKFNAKQKISAGYNKSFVTLCWENCYSVDTIPIPVIKYTPNTINTIDLNIK